MLLRNIMRKRGRILGSLEQKILEILWELGEGTVRDVLARMKAEKHIAYTTIMTVMNRMNAKGYVRRHALPNGAFRYKPRYTREEFYARTNKFLIDELIKNFGSIAVAQFVDTLEEFDPKQLDVLRKKLLRGRPPQKYE